MNEFCGSFTSCCNCNIYCCGSGRHCNCNPKLLRFRRYGKPTLGLSPRQRLPKPRVPKSGIPKTGIPKAGIPKTEIPKAGIPKLGIPKMVRFRAPLIQTPLWLPLTMVIHHEMYKLRYLWLARLLARQFMTLSPVPFSRALLDIAICLLSNLRPGHRMSRNFGLSGLSKRHFWKTVFLSLLKTGSLHTVDSGQDFPGTRTRKRHIHFLTHKRFEMALDPRSTSRLTRRNCLFFWIGRRAHKLFCPVNWPVVLGSTEPSPKQKAYVHVPFSRPRKLTSPHVRISPAPLGTSRTKTLCKAPFSAVDQKNSMQDNFGLISHQRRRDDNKNKNCIFEEVERGGGEENCPKQCFALQMPCQ